MVNTSLAQAAVEFKMQRVSLLANVLGGTRTENRFVKAISKTFHSAMSVRITPPIVTKKTEAAEDEAPERAELPYNFEKELIENQNRHFCGHKTFVPCKIVEPLEMKFYAQHDQNTLDYEKYTPFVAQRGKRRARGILPHLSAEVYGWLPVNLAAANVKELNFICAPKIRTEMTIHGERVVSERVTERPPFNGLRFVV